MPGTSKMLFHAERERVSEKQLPVASCQYPVNRVARSDLVSSAAAGLLLATEYWLLGTVLSG